MSLGYYTDGGSMRGSGIDDRDVSWSFTCQSCEHDNDDIDATTDGNEVWASCEVCGMPNNGRIDN